MLLPLVEETLELYRQDHFCLHVQPSRRIFYHYSAHVEDLTSLQNGVLKYAFSTGIREVVYRDRKLYTLKGEQLDATRRIGSGSYGEVVLLTHFRVVAKLIQDKGSQLSELAAYSLIQAAYSEPEKVGLPRLLAHTPGCLLLPDYGEELGLQRDEAVLQKVGRALYALHLLGILHRDLKPANILYNKGNPIIVDFGLSCWHIFTRSREGSTSIQSMFYRAPEVCLKSKNISFPSDWWSYGVILASRKKPLHTPIKNAELRESLRYIFGLARLTRTELQLAQHPVCVPASARPFLCLNPQKRGGIKVTNLEMLRLLPSASLLHTHSLQVTRYLLGEVSSWLSFFAANEYCARVSPEKGVKIAEFLFARDLNSCVVPEQLVPHLYELNTYTLCLLRHGQKVWYLRPCLILSLRGSKFTPAQQAEWIENTFLNDLPGSCPEIEKVYLSNQLLLTQFQLPEKLSTYFE